jgi:hypothetical protein
MSGAIILLISAAMARAIQGRLGVILATARPLSLASAAFMLPISLSVKPQRGVSTQSKLLISRAEIRALAMLPGGEIALIAKTGPPS